MQIHTPGGKAKTLMLVHISPEPISYGETISTLKFAERVASVELGAARLNKESGEVRELKEQVDSLKKALAIKEAELAQLQSMKESPLIDKNKLHTPVRTRRLSLEGPAVSKVEVQNGFCSIGVGSQDKSVYSGERAKLDNNNEMPVGKQNGNRRSSLGSDRRNSLVKNCTEGETNTGTDTVAPSASKKTSQIKKSLQSFGKLINGGEKRTTTQVESSPPVTRIERRLSSGGQSQPLSSRHPLTAVNNSGNGRARRNSLEGKPPVESKQTASPYGHAERTCKTPPDQQSMKAGKRRL